MSSARITQCPLLPRLNESLSSEHTRSHRETCGVDFYMACLELAQSKLLSGKPAQAILQLNKSMMAEIPPNHSILEQNPMPYQALIWILSQNHVEDFLGNPTRHFQHLASRMSPNSPRPSIRKWRAWTCFHISKSILSPVDFPEDTRQIANEGLIIPCKKETVEKLSGLTPHTSEISTIKKLLP